MQQIPLTQGEKTIIDDQDFKLIKDFRWRLAICNGIKYAKTSKGRRNQQKIIYMHRLIMKAPIGKVVDHINGNGLDNRRENLEVVTQSVNLHRKKSSKGRMKGVWKVKSRSHLKRPWTAQIKVNKKAKHLGYFRTAREAAEAYAEASRKYYGD